MAKNNIRFSNDPNDEMKQLLEMLDRMQNRPLAQEVEDVLIQHGRPDLVKDETLKAEKAPSTFAQDEFVPTFQTNNLADLLITPSEDPMFPDSEGRVHEDVGDEKATAALLNMGQADEEEDEDWEKLPPAPEKKQNAVMALLRGAALVLPRKGDKPLRVLAKSGFWLGLVAFVLVAVLLVNDMAIAPAKQERLHRELLDQYQASTDATVAGGGDYPPGMLASFKQLYQRNSDVAGWLSFHADGKDFLNIEYPFVKSDDDYYKNHDFDKEESDFGTLYTDGRIEGYYAADRVLAIYSNCTPNQSMLSSMNRLVGPVDYARAVPELTLTTLYRRDVYYVFAVALTDASGKDPFKPVQTSFADDDAFLQYIQSLGARSLFDYPVDVTCDDSLLLLSVPTASVSTGIQDGQIVVAARRRHPGETPPVANQIMKNKDAIMPYSWYMSRNKTLHPFFYSGVEPVDTTTDTTYPTTSLEIPDATTSTTVDESGLVGGTLVEKDPTATQEPTPDTTTTTGSVASTTTTTASGTDSSSTSTTKASTTMFTVTTTTSTSVTTTTTEQQTPNPDDDTTTE